LRNALNEQIESVYGRLVQGHKNKIRGLLDRMMPLAQIHQTLPEVLSYLNEEDLLQVQDAHGIFRTATLNAHWERLDEIRDNVGKSASELGPRDRGMRFAKASRFARRMEVAAAKHYDFDDEDAPIKCAGCTEMPARLYDQPLYHDGDRDYCTCELCSNFEFFVRLSRRQEQALIWEGFLPVSLGGYGWVYFDLIALQDKAYWPELEPFLEWVQDDERSSHPWSETGYQDHMKRIVDNLNVTVISYDPRRGKSPEGLLVSSGSSSERFGNLTQETGMLHPRHKISHNRPDVLEECIVPYLVFRDSHLLLGVAGL